MGLQQQQIHTRNEIESLIIHNSIVLTNRCCAQASEKRNRNNMAAISFEGWHRFQIAL